MTPLWGFCVGFRRPREHPIDAILRRFRNRRIVQGNFPSDAANRETGKVRGVRPEVRKIAR